MNTLQITPGLKTSGRWQFRLQSTLIMSRALLGTAIQRMRRGPAQPNWNYTIEYSVEFLRSHYRAAFEQPSMALSREFEDSMVVFPPAVAQVGIEAVDGPVRGHWYRPRDAGPAVTMLYLHGGGYIYYSLAHVGLIAQAALAAGAHTFAPDYRLAPEHPYPAQLEDALAAYRWLLDGGAAPERLVVAGDSAGGNLVISLLAALRDAGLPLPALGICLAPWTDVSPGAQNPNAPHDWIEARMAQRWSEWFCGGMDPGDPRLSPVYANLGGLPPLYIQAGSAEMLHPMICVFAEAARRQGATVTLDVWPGMVHDFQAFGDLAPESREALARIGEVVRKYTA